jgi:hypothetical protein
MIVIIDIPKASNVDRKRSHKMKTTFLNRKYWGQVIKRWSIEWIDRFRTSKTGLSFDNRFRMVFLKGTRFFKAFKSQLVDMDGWNVSNVIWPTSVGRRRRNIYEPISEHNSEKVCLSAFSSSRRETWFFVRISSWMLAMPVGSSIRPVVRPGIKMRRPKEHSKGTKSKDARTLDQKGSAIATCHE